MTSIMVGGNWASHIGPSFKDSFSTHTCTHMCNTPRYILIYTTVRTKPQNQDTITGLFHFTILNTKTCRNADRLKDVCHKVFSCPRVPQSWQTVYSSLHVPVERLSKFHETVSMFPWLIYQLSRALQCRTDYLPFHIQLVWGCMQYVQFFLWHLQNKQKNIERLCLILRQFTLSCFISYPWIYNLVFGCRYSVFFLFPQG